MNQCNHILKNGGCTLKKSGCSKHCGQKLHVYDWLSDDREHSTLNELVEVQFKNTRKGYFRNTNNLPIYKGDVVAVESSPGHDIGEVTLIGRLVEVQMKKNRIDPKHYEIKKIYRKAKVGDLDKYEESKGRENETMLKSRKIAESLNLKMKIGEVEFQGDGNKAIFYYIADEWVDFRQLIKHLAEEFKVRIEMKQIGSRQEAGLIGGIGSCGRELCCSSWMTHFMSVSTNAARYQDVPLNPQKLAGQCSKLKCCLNFELDSYIDAQKKMPQSSINLETADATYYHFKSDVLRGLMLYSTSKGIPSNLVTLTASQVRDVITLNRSGKKPISLIGEVEVKEVKSLDFENVVGQDDLTRFDQQRKRKSNYKGKKPNQVSRSSDEESSSPQLDRKKSNNNSNNKNRRKPNNNKDQSQNNNE